MTDEAMDKILGKIEKLISLAGNNNHVEEADAAMEKVQELLTKYNLTMQDIEVKTTESKNNFVKSDQLSVSATTNFLDTIIGWLCGEAYHVRSVYYTGRTYDSATGKMKRTRTRIFIGRKANVIVSSQMHGYFRAEIQRRWLHYRNTVSGGGVKIRKSFMYACYESLLAKIEASQKKVEEEMALVLFDEGSAIDDWISEEMNPTTRRQQYNSDHLADQEAIKAGKSAGNAISISGQIN
jgi:anion-transporting  ArsA/GET3 family ATPase